MSDPAILPRPMVLEEFTPLVGRAFTADCEPRSVDLELVEASALRPNALSARPPFILVFRSGVDAMLADGGYILRCGGWGPDIIYLLSLTPPADAPPGFYYQAVFN